MHYPVNILTLWPKNNRKQNPFSICLFQEKKKKTTKESVSKDVTTLLDFNTICL